MSQMRRSVFLGLCLLLLSRSIAAGPAPIEVKDPWIREAPPVAKVLAGYMNIINTSEQPVSIIGISSPWFENVELHQTVTENGVARMLMSKQFEIDANSTLKLEPGGYHLMLFNPKKALRAGQNVQFTLEISNGDTIDLDMKVRKGNAAVDSHSHHHH